jgi:nucleotide-binding universal stress UspA family protein
MVPMMKILLAIDDSPCSDAAVQAVLAQFRPADSEVSVFHSVELPSTLIFAAETASADDLTELRDGAIRAAEVLVARVAKTLKAAGFTVTKFIEPGAPKDAILDYAAKWHPDLIVLGSHGRKGLDRLLLGSVAEGVARHAATAVQIVRPPPV